MRGRRIVDFPSIVWTTLYGGIWLLFGHAPARWRGGAHNHANRSLAIDNTVTSDITTQTS